MILMAKKKQDLPPEVLEYFKKQGAKGGKKGGKMSWANLTPEERTERARRAALAPRKKRVKL